MIAAAGSEIDVLGRGPLKVLKWDFACGLMLMCEKQPDTPPLPPAMCIWGGDFQQRSQLAFASDPKQAAGSGSPREVTPFPNLGNAEWCPRRHLYPKAPTPKLNVHGMNQVLF